MTPRPQFRLMTKTADIESRRASMVNKDDPILPSPSAIMLDPLYDDLGPVDIFEFLQEHPVSIVADAGPRRHAYGGSSTGSMSEWHQMNCPITNILSLCPTHEWGGTCNYVHNLLRTNVDFRIDFAGTLHSKLPLEQVGRFGMRQMLRFLMEGMTTLDFDFNYGHYIS